MLMTWKELDEVMREQNKKISFVMRKLKIGRSTYYRKVRDDDPLRLTLEEHAWLREYLFPDADSPEGELAAMKRLDEIVAEQRRPPASALLRPAPPVESTLPVPNVLKQDPDRIVEVLGQVDLLRMVVRDELRKIDAFQKEMRATPYVPGHQILRQGDVRVFLRIFEALQNDKQARQGLAVLLLFSYYVDMNQTEPA